MSDVPPPPPPSTPPPAAPMPSGGAPVNTFLVPSIVVTIIGFCTCFGFIPGIVALIFAILANNKLKAGDVVGAQSNAKIAKIFLIIAIVLIVIGIIWNIVSFASGGGAWFNRS